MQKTAETNAPIPLAVLGAGGFVGGRLTQIAKRAGTFKPKPILRSFRGLARLGGAATEACVIDTSDLTALTEAFRGHPTVINLTMGDTLKILEDTQVVYEACVQAGVQRLIHMSSAVVYGRVTDPTIHDDSPPSANLGMLYAEGKAAAENWLREKLSNPKPKITLLRPSLIWGPTSNWSEMVGDQLLHKRAVLSNQGKGVANLVYVDNLVKIILAVAAKPEVGSGFYNVSDAETVTWQQYYTSLAKRLGYPVSDVVLWEDDKLRPGPKHAVEWALEHRSLFMLSKAILKRVSPGVKQTLKSALKAAPEPPGGYGGPPGPPALSIAHWGLQNTPNKLPTAKIHKDFGPLNLIPFETALDTTATWLKFAGFAADETVSKPAQPAKLTV